MTRGRGSDGASQGHSLLGLGEQLTVWQRVGSTFVILLMAAILLLGLLGVHFPENQPVVQAVAREVVHIGYAFCGIALVFIWWQPRFLKRLYLWAERKIIVVYCGILVLGAVFVLASHLISLLREAIA